jgi:kinesin family protein 6/9
MCYGQTGAGKTFTMTGATENFVNRGVIPRALLHLFREIETRPEQAISIR